MKVRSKTMMILMLAGICGILGSSTAKVSANETVSTPQARAEAAISYNTDILKQAFGYFEGQFARLVGGGPKSTLAPDSLDQ